MSLARLEVVAAGARSSSRSERAAASWVFAERVFLCFLRNERDAPLHRHNRNDPAHVPAGTSRRRPDTDATQLDNDDFCVQGLRQLRRAVG